METEYWRKCSVCKKPIGLKTRYYVCSVSTCNGQRTGYVFCSIQCFETHLPGARHRDAGAIEKISPAQPEASAPDASVTAPTGATTPKRVIASAPASVAAAPSRSQIPRETLVVVSKVKDYIRARSEMNTSDGIMMLLSDRIRELCDEAIESARQDGRKTVLDRDLKRKS